ncbi:hypothetical protein [Gluconacetobacter takamatsuzukensis]|uniref:Uncharacterized protein n=1 Tax=Gluconacetobacter takamatsuzukensis TaxID=1286190 RepID=A0A7W4KC86_9PROT|nr:hypothetical protein [Gluconacetobacter takamatsuzukensis]MBB2204274.1 hypothetical protein [Gluconacetobacter takamatsuzukensis]
MRQYRFSFNTIPLPLAGTIFLLLLFLRHPAAILDANFWGEDGWFWYPDAYKIGVRSLLLPHTGYLQTISRLGGLAAQLVSVRWGPTVFAVIALVVQMLPALFLVSRRFDALWPHYPSRLAFALVYVGLPNSVETSGNLTNSQWYLAILAFLVIVSAPPRGGIGRLGDSVALVLSGLSGPFCILLLPVAVWNWWLDRGREGALRLALVLATTTIQAVMLVQTMGQSRPKGPLGVTLPNLVHIIAMKLVFALCLASHQLERLVRTSDIVAGVLSVAVVTILVLAWRYGTTLFRQFALFGALVFSASLVTPVGAGPSPWVTLGTLGGGARYFVIPLLVVAAAFFTLAATPRGRLSSAGLALCLLMTIGIVRDRSYPHMTPTDFNRVANAFANAPAGTRMVFPVRPEGEKPMVLIKK